MPFLGDSSIEGRIMIDLYTTVSSSLHRRPEQALLLSLSVMSRKLGYTHAAQLLRFDWLVSGGQPLSLL